ncbi:MAG TPA: Hsp70 family protein [Syntrophomonadaceae bacterium]|nr:Hsp70 family protein [Syntrophomonadaceae bacterium]
MNLAIDFGTSFTKIGYMSDGHFNNLTGLNGLPSAFAYIRAKDQLLFGYNALQLSGPDIYLFPNFKLELKRNLNFSVGSYNLAEILYHFFAFLDEEYIRPSHIAFTTISLAIPNYFGLNARQLLIKTLDRIYPKSIIYLIPEPVAALAGHIIVNKNEEIDGDILVIDMGGGTSDFSFLTFSSEDTEIIIESQVQMGQDVFSGLEIDKAILHHILLPSLKGKTNIERLDSSYRRLLKLAETIKIQVSNHGHFYINEPDLLPGYSFIEEFKDTHILKVVNSALTKLRQYFINHIVGMAKNLGLYNGIWKLDKVLLLGGTSKTIGIHSFWANIFHPTTVNQPLDKTLNVVKGLAVWPEIMNSPINIKTIYPFNFYIQTLENNSYQLESIHFDTSMLELDIHGQYTIFSFPVNSIYNLSDNKNELKLKIYEVAEENEANLDRFIGQEIVLDLQEPIYDGNQYIEVKLNFSSAELTADFIQVNPQSPKTSFPELALEIEADWLTFIEGIDLISPEFKQDLSDFLHGDLTTAQPVSSQLEFMKFKLLTLLNYIS